MKIHINLQAYSFSNPSNERKPDTYVVTDNIRNIETTTLSPQAHTAEKKFQEISRNYDIHNISRSERHTLTSDLIENGLITNDIALHLTKPLSMNESQKEKVDFLQLMKKSLEFDKNSGLNHKHLKAKIKTIDILERLHSQKA